MSDVLTVRPARWPWACFLIAAVWVVLIRVPLVLNARAHLDSDLAVDGFMLREATEGSLRWHYPGTPHIGSASVLLSLPQAMIWGTSAESLVSGGTVAALGLVLGTFLMTWRSAGPQAAAWSLAPLTFASNGAVWLSARITGGHLLAACWHAGAFALFVGFARRGGIKSGLALGLWSGLGLFVDSMFSVTLAGLLPVVAIAVVRLGKSGWIGLVGLVLGFSLGQVPREVGKRVEPYNAYGPQFETITEPAVLIGHARLLARECLPRLIAGHRIPGLETDPITATTDRGGTAIGPIPVLATLLSLGLWGVSWLAIGRAILDEEDRASRLVGVGLILSALATIAGFILNRNIFNTDNYRYLVTLLVPWGFGFGLLAARLARKGFEGKALACGITLAMATVMTADLSSWQHQLGWVDDRSLPVTAKVENPLVDWLDAHPEVSWVEGAYWDVYRLAFLAKRTVRGRPFSRYPNRFPEWKPPSGPNRILVGRSFELLFLQDALRNGGKAVFQAKGVTIVQLPALPP